jgi:replicative DNA helicase
MNQVENFTNYGKAFQSKTIVCLIKDKLFIQQILDILETKYFESESDRWIVDMIKTYFTKYKKVPTMDAIKVALSEIDNEILKVGVVENLKGATRYVNADDLEFVKEKCIDFCRNQNLKNAILQSVDLLSNGNFDGIKKLVDDAMKAGTERDIGHDYKVDINTRFEESVRKCIPTSWDSVNELTGGGLAAGELGVIVAPAGIGKSWALVVIGTEAVKKKLNVIHYSLELNEAYIGLRYDASFTAIAMQNLKWEREKIEKKVSKLPGNLIVKHFPTRTATVNSLSAHIEKTILAGYPPDMIVVDYADLLRDVSLTKEYRHALGNIYEDLRGLAGIYEVPVWTASQANRSALEEDVIDATKVAEAYSKVMTADFVMSLSRKVNDKISGTGRWHVIKNRFGPDGMTLPCKMDTSNGQIFIYDESSYSGQEQQGKMNQGQEFIRKELSKKFSQIG